MLDEQYYLVHISIYTFEGFRS
ncbi:hypothetical protein PAE4_40262 [Bacillus altitudinis]|nr:hypothetical protein PAE4_40262 [Bacillus altitudinis]